MKRDLTYVIRSMKQCVGYGLLLYLLLMPSLAAAAALIVQTKGNPSNAAAGESGANISSSALLSVLVTRHGAGTPVADIGDSVGDGTNAISLPTGWTLTTGFNVSPGGCLMTPTEFFNLGNGIYDIRVVPFVDNPDCTWLSGEYHYVVEINVTIGRQPFSGSGLGVLRIPDR
jgi:hypothetical protein